MDSKVLPSDAGDKYSPATLEEKEISEESRAKNYGRRHLSADDESAEFSDSEPGDSDPETGGLSASPSVQGQNAAPLEGDLPAGQIAAARKPIPPNPDFEPMKNVVPGENFSFSGWVVKRELCADGTYPVVFGDEGTYESIENATAAVSEETREAILAEARVEAEDIRRQASVEGVQKGYEQGMTQAREELRAEMVPVFEELRNSIKGVVDYRDEVLHSAEQEIFELAVLISKKVLYSELQMRPEAVLEVVRHALDRAVGWGKATAQVNPEDYAFMEEHRLLLNEEAEGVALVRIESNPSITRGGCFLESNFGEIDARLEKQVEAVESALRETLADRADQRVAESNDEPDAVPADSSATPAEESAGPEEIQSSVQPYQPEELGTPPEEQEGQ